MLGSLLSSSALKIAACSKSNFSCKARAISKSLAPERDASKPYPASEWSNVGSADESTKLAWNFKSLVVWKEKKIVYNTIEKKTNYKNSTITG